MSSSPFHEVRVATLEELFAIAEAMEVEAARRYATMARTMDVAGSNGLAGLFRELERAEQAGEPATSPSGRRPPWGAVRHRPRSAG